MIRIEIITPENVDDIPQIDGFDCQSCLYWEYPEEFKKKINKQVARKLKRKWFSQWTLEQNAGGLIAYFKEEPIGYCQFGPPNSLPSSRGYPTGDPIANSTYISCIVVKKEFRRKGIAYNY